MDIFGTKKLASKVENLSQQIVASSEQKKLEVQEIETKANQQIEQLKASRQQLFNSFNSFNTQIFPHYDVIKRHLVYQTNAMVYSVVSKLAVNSAMIPFYGYDKKKGTDLPETDKLALFLNTLDFSEKEILYTYLYLCGEVFAYKNKLEFGVNAGLGSLRFLHPDKMVVRITDTFPREITGYTYYDPSNGEIIDIDTEDMIFIKFPNPSVEIHEEFRGLSPIKVLCRTLTRIQAGEDITVAQLQNGGGKDIVYDKTPGLEAGVLGSRRDSYSRFATNKSNYGAPYFAAGEMDVLHLGSSLLDLDVSTLASMDFDMICNAYGISAVLFNKSDASTESNVQEMKKEMYTNTIIPNIVRVRDILNKYAVPDIKTNGIIKEDTSEIKELQEDESKLATALAAMWWLTPNEKRQRMAYDKDDKTELMEQYILPSGAQLLTDLEIQVPDVVNTANDYNNTVNTAAKLLSIKTGTNA